MRAKIKKFSATILLSTCVTFLYMQTILYSDQKRVITIKGSDTMVILGQRWSETYMKKEKQTIIQITGGGSGTGIAALINGSADIVQSSRAMKKEERVLVYKRRGKEVEEIPVALDGIAVYVHPTNPLETISLDQIKKIYLGQMNQWGDLGVPPGEIIAYGRENNSGTYIYFKEHVLGNEDFAPEILTLPGTAAIINAVSKDKKAIGYGGIAYSKGIKILKVSREGQKPLAPTQENVIKGKYPISRHLYFYTAGKPEGSVKKFIDWVLTLEGQKICEEVGYYPLPTSPLTSKVTKKNSQ